MNNPASETLVWRRTLRLALGTSFALIASQLLNIWNLNAIAYVMALLTMILLLFPAPAPSLKQGVGFLLLITVPCYAGFFLLVPLFEIARWSGILLLMLALFACFYYAARGGTPAVALFITLALSLVVTLGSIEPDILLAATEDISVAACGSLLFVWLAHACLPDPPLPARHRPSRSGALTDTQAAMAAFRALIIILPATIFCLYSPNSAAYVAVMMKVAIMGQQSSSDHSRAMARSLLQSTLWGGLMAIIGWQMVSLWPSLLMYAIFIALVMLCVGHRVFQADELSPQSDMWLYALITMFALLGPSVLDILTSQSASEAFYSRLWMFIGITGYGVIAVSVFDAFLPQRWQPPSTSQEPS